MEKNINDDYNKEKIDRNLLLFDNGFTELSYNGKNETINKNEIEGLKRKNINWYTFYLILFKNTLPSKSLVPKEELKLRLNIIRQYLPPYYNCQKNIEKSNSNSILKKFTYHLYSKNNILKKIIDTKNNQKLLLFDDENDNENENNPNTENTQLITRRLSRTRTQSQSLSVLNMQFLNEKKKSTRKSICFLPGQLNIIQEYNTKNTSQEKGVPNKKGSSKSINKKLVLGTKLSSTPKKDNISSKKSNLKYLDIENVKIKFAKKNSELNNIENNKEILIRTPNDNEYPLILTDKRMINNNNQTYFMGCLNKLNDETKNEKINTCKKEICSQVLKFNDIYFDAKIDDFSQDNLFNEIKNTCDLFINKFNFDNQEEKNLGDLDKFL